MDRNQSIESRESRDKSNKRKPRGIRENTTMCDPTKQRRGAGTICENAESLSRGNYGTKVFRHQKNNLDLQIVVTPRIYVNWCLELGFLGMCFPLREGFQSNKAEREVTWTLSKTHASNVHLWSLSTTRLCGFTDTQQRTSPCTQEKPTLVGPASGLSIRSPYSEYVVGFPGRDIRHVVGSAYKVWDDNNDGAHQYVPFSEILHSMKLLRINI